MSTTATEWWLRTRHEEFSSSGDEPRLIDEARAVEIRMQGRCRSVEIHVERYGVELRAIYGRGVEPRALEGDLRAALYDILPAWVEPDIRFDLLPF